MSEVPEGHLPLAESFVWLGSRPARCVSDDDARIPSCFWTDPRGNPSRIERSHRLGYAGRTGGFSFQAPPARSFRGSKEGTLSNVVITGTSTVIGQATGKEWAATGALDDDSWTDEMRAALGLDVKRYLSSG
jgi:hypothetical protein